jgi:thiamine biosynthesis lipoprotein
MGMVLVIALPTVPQRFEYTEIHMGVEARLVLHAPDEASAKDAARAAFDRIAELDSILSDYRPDSELMRVCNDGRTGRRTLTPDLYRVLRRARDIAVLSDGAFDVTVGPLVRLWREARHEHRLPDPSSIAAAMDRVGWSYLRLDDTSPVVELLRPAMLLDLGGIGKGFAADEALAVLAAAGYKRSLVDIGGDIAVGDPPPGATGWRISTGASQQPLHVTNCGVATSGDTEQFVEIDGVRYSHIVDPETGLGLTNRIEVTIFARDATTADALASAVSVLGPARGRAMIRQGRPTDVFVGVRSFICGIAAPLGANRPPRNAPPGNGS